MDDKSFKVIFHIDESEKWELLLKNVSNLTRIADPKFSKIEVLANSEAVKEFVPDAGNPYFHLMGQLSGQGVLFTACNNALNGLGIKRAELMPFVSIVPAGVLELIERQKEGYAYIKP